MKMPSKRQLIGRTIVDYKANPFSDGRGGTAHDPALVLDDGSVLRFVVEETEAHYGVFIAKARARGRKRKETR